jgi:hypothetical protein
MDAPTAASAPYAPCARIASELAASATMEFKSLAAEGSEPMKVLLTVRATDPDPDPVRDEGHGPSAAAGEGPLFVALVGDVSLSMDQQGVNAVDSYLVAMKRSMAKLIDGPLTGRGAQLAVYEFGEEAAALTDGFVDLGVEQGRADAAAAIDAVGTEDRYRGGTDISAGAEMALAGLTAAMDASGQARPRGVVCLLTDGRPNEGPYRHACHGPSLAKALRKLRGPRAISLGTMALGTAPQRAYLEAITTGPFAFAPTEKELGEAFELSAKAFGAAAHNVTLKVRDATGVRSFSLGMVPRTGTEPLFAVETKPEGAAFDYALVVGDGDGDDVGQEPDGEWFAWTPVDLPRYALAERPDRDGTMPEALEDAVARETASAQVATVLKRARTGGGRAAYDELRALEEESASLGPRRQRTTSLVSTMVEQLGGRLLSDASSYVSMDSAPSSHGFRSAPTPYDTRDTSELLGLEAAQSMTSYSQSFA